MKSAERISFGPARLDLHKAGCRYITSSNRGCVAPVAPKLRGGPRGRFGFRTLRDPSSGRHCEARRWAGPQNELWGEGSRGKGREGKVKGGGKEGERRFMGSFSLWSG